MNWGSVYGSPFEMSEKLPSRSLAPLLIRAGVAFAVLAALVAVVWLQLSAPGEGDLRERIEAIMAQARDSTWGLALMVLVLGILNVAGVPLMILTAGATVVAGTVLTGFAVSWAASMIGAAGGFALGRFTGGELVRAYGGERVNALSKMAGRRGILTSFGIRQVPTAPAVMVNMAIGASHISFWKFLVGTGLGIAPKLAFIAAVTKGVLALETRFSFVLTAGLAALLVFWIVTMVVLRRFVKRLAPETGPDDPAQRSGS